MSATTPAPSSTSFIDTLFSYDNTITLAAVISLLLVILFVLLLHLYARWFLTHHHRRRRRLSAITTFDFSSVCKDGGLDAKAIKLIPLFTYKPTEKEASECAVCLSVFEEGEVGRTLPRCLHSFHVECIDTWLGAHSSCPLCRLDVMPAPADDTDKKEVTANTEENGGDDVVLDIGDDKSVSESSGESSAKLSSCESVNLEMAARMGVSRSWRSDVVRANQNNGFQRHRPSI